MQYARKMAEGDKESFHLSIAYSDNAVRDDLISQAY